MRGFLVAGYAGVAAVSLWLRSAVPAQADGQAVYDDFLFVRLAYRLGAGLWLGPYDNLTLAKGMAYPAFILASFVSGVPLKLAEQAVYLAAAGLAAWLVTKLTDKRWLAFLLFVCLAGNPVLWSPAFARVIREGLYVSLSLIVLLLAAGLLLPRADRLRPVTARLVLPVGLGAVGAAYWLTREEGIWLVPSLLVLVGAAMASIWHRWARENDRAGAVRSLARLGAGTAIAGIVFAALVGSVAGMNYLYYGAFTTNEFKSASFVSAYGALSRIHQREWQRYVVFPADARAQAYAVSPAAAELRPVLDGERGEGVRRFACAELRRDPCPETPSGWFMWVLRDAAAAAGHHASARAAYAFYDRLAAEINAACEDGRLSCDPARASILPPFRWHYLGDALAVVPALLRVTASLGDGDVGARPSIGANAVVELIATLVGPVSRRATPSMTWMAAVKTVDPLVFVRDRSGAAFAMQVRPATPAGEALTGGPAAGTKAAWFEVETDCLRPTCELIVSSGGHERAYPISPLLHEDVNPDGKADVSIVRVLKSFGTSGSRTAVDMLRGRQLALARGIATVYAAVMPALSVLAAVGVVLALVTQWRRPLPDGLLALALACGVAVATRIAMLAYVQVTWIPVSVNLAYVSPATPFLIIFVALGLYLGVMALRRSATERTG